MIRPALDGIDIYLCVAPVDFRKQVNGLSMLVESQLSLDPLSSAVFAFTNRRRDRVKLLV
jgi:transposase